MGVPLPQNIQKTRAKNPDAASTAAGAGYAEERGPLLRPVMPELDTIRGLAIIAVVFYHGFFWQADLSRYGLIPRLFLVATWTGRLGVNLFFVLSGFLITGLLLDSRDRADYYRRFYIRRALRILPAYAVIVAVLALTRYTSAAFLLLSAAYMSNLTPLFGVAIGYPVLWSLAVEEHFYFLWPAVARRLSPRALLCLAAGIVALSPLARLLTFYLARRNGFVSFQVYDYTWNSLDGLACGAVLAILLRKFSFDRNRLFRSAGLLLLLSVTMWAVGAPFGILTRQRPLGAALQVVPWHFAFTACLALFLLLGTSQYAAAVRLRPLRFFGEISYGLYLVHLLIFDAYDGLFRQLGWEPARDSGSLAALAVRFLVVSAVATPLAFLSRKYFEERFLRFKSRWT